MIRNLLPSVWRRSESPLRKEDEHPFYALQREMDNVFDNFFRFPTGLIPKKPTPVSKTGC